MMCQLDDQNGIITVWVKNGEQVPPISLIRRQYERNSYKVAIFHSGSMDMKYCLNNILTHAKK